MRYSCAPAYGFGKSKKLELAKSEKLYTPGPGKYEPNKVIREMPSWKMGTSKRPELPNINNPGPGAYNIRNKFPEGPSYSIVKPTKLFKDNADKEQIPGPGSYNVTNTRKINLKNSYTFGQKYKSHEKDNSPVPGPGSYEAKEFFGNEGKKISMGPKYNSKFDSNPGPGQYDTKNYNSIIFKKLPDIKLGKANRFLNANNAKNNPGPGRYNSIDSGISSRVKSPSWKMGTSERKPLNVSDSPGPGSYDLRTNLGDDAPQYSMRQKEKYSDNKVVSPGPGRYNSDEYNTHRRYPAWKMGTGQRDEDLRRHIREGFPGPGAYMSNDFNLQNSPKYKFGTGERVKDRTNGIPGPGSYHIPCSIVDVNSYTREQGVFDNNFKFI